MIHARRPRCLIADDHPALVAAVSSYLKGNGFDVVSVARDGAEALELATELRPDVALVDYRMPRLAGAELVSRLRAADPELRVLVYTADAEERELPGLLAAGAAGVVLKEAPLVDLARALHAVLEGRPYLDPGFASIAFRAPGQNRDLTGRETDVLELMAEGLQYEEIGRRLSISAETVRTHVRKATTRLEADTSTQAVATALRRRLIA